ncbi:MAG: RluA family pseudouridine synthase [Candidatus Kapabacteria bacterium]|nr:RluA family pseudouridine synthase [Candidatus Kapabacteria bacterium]
MKAESILDSDPNYPPLEEHVVELHVPPAQRPVRLDVYVTESIRHATRTRVQEAIEAGMISVNGRAAKASYRVQPGDRIVCRLLRRPPIELLPEPIPLDILFEDEDVLVINKPAGMVVHPAHGNRTGTLVNAVLYHLGIRTPISIADSDELDEESESSILASAAVRPGIVHRLDKDTSGVMVIAKHEDASMRLSRQFAERRVHRLYHGFVWGIVGNDEGRIETQLGRSPRNRKLFAVVSQGGKPAITTYRVRARYRFATFLELKLHTGRTHQIRVHMAHIGHPLIGDESYGGASPGWGGLQTNTLRSLAHKCCTLIQRQALHASVLGFFHPRSGQYLEFTTPFPPDMQQLSEFLEHNAKE